VKRLLFGEIKPKDDIPTKYLNKARVFFSSLISIVNPVKELRILRRVLSLVANF
jgi:hypothetical protein